MKITAITKVYWLIDNQQLQSIYQINWQVLKIRYKTLQGLEVFQVLLDIGCMYLVMFQHYLLHKALVNVVSLRAIFEITQFWLLSQNFRFSAILLYSFRNNAVFIFWLISKNIARFSVNAVYFWFISGPVMRVIRGLAVVLFCFQSASNDWSFSSK